MGPRVFTRGNKSRQPRSCRLSRYFNGATRLHAWKRASILYALTKDVTSMGPRVFTRGNTHDLSTSNEGRRLQWGHASSRVETCRPVAGLEAMKILQWGHASSRVETRHCANCQKHKEPTSMGPRVFT